MGLFENARCKRRKIEVCIELHDDTIIYDAENLIDKKIRVNRDMNEQASNLQQADHLENQDRSILLRSLSRWKSEIKNLLSSYIIDRGVYAVSNDIEEKEGVEAIVLSFPDNWPRYSLDGLKEEMHEYLVRGVMSDYEKNTDINQSNIDYAMAQDSRTRIISLIHKRTN